MAICVLSPISTRKNAISVVPNTPNREESCSFVSSNLSGIIIQTAIAMNDRPSAQRITSGPNWRAMKVPTAPARKWFASVATKIPRMIGHGFRKRAASTSASSWVLSAISASATTPMETRRAVKVVFSWEGGR